MHVSIRAASNRLCLSHLQRLHVHHKDDAAPMGTMNDFDFAGCTINTADQGAAIIANGQKGDVDCVSFGMNLFTKE
jgi:hypothetical protein